LKYCLYQPYSEAIPGGEGFSSTSAAKLPIFQLGQRSQVAVYAKLAIQNGYTNIFGFLGQYFDGLYTTDTNGAATTNSAGYVTPYGEILPMQAGRLALVTMPDLDTGERGTN